MPASGATKPPAFWVNLQEGKDPAVLQDMAKETGKSFMRWTLEVELGQGKWVTVSATRI